MRFSACLMSVILCLVCQAEKKPDAPHNPAPGLHLKLIRTIDLNKSKGQIDELVELPDGGFLVRDSTFDPLQSQSVEVYSHSGTLLRTIGRFGKEPGRYYALNKIAFSRRHNVVWVGDMMGRISRFDLSGRLIDTVLLQKPGYHPDDIVLDEERDRYYVTGCVALHFYLDLGCQIVHEYELSTNKYIRSFLETDPEAVAKKYFGIENYQIGVAPAGQLYAIDSPIPKLWKIVPGSKVESFPVPSKVIERIPELDPTKDNSNVGAQHYLLHKLVVANRTVILSASKKGPDGNFLEVFSFDGRPIALDVPAPGLLLGKSPRDTLWFAQRSPSGFRVAEYSY